MEEKKSILKLITYTDDSETNIGDYKSKLDNLFKNYELNDTIDFKNIFQFYFNVAFTDILSEKMIYQNINKLIMEMEQIDLEKIKNEISTNIEKIEPELDKIIRESENHKFFLFNRIRKVKKYINLNNKAKNADFHNPFKILEHLENYDLDYISDN